MEFPPVVALVPAAAAAATAGVQRSITAQTASIKDRPHAVLDGCFLASTVSLIRRRRGARCTAAVNVACFQNKSIDPHAWLMFSKSHRHKGLSIPTPGVEESEWFRAVCREMVAE
jgi:hypothetical protein